MGRHVARAPRIAVVPPGAADAVRPLQHDEVGDAFPPQPYGGPQPPNPDPTTATRTCSCSAMPMPSLPDSASEHWRNGRVEQLRTDG